MKLFLVRGLPGSGKTTFAKQVSELVFEADQFFYNEAGEYRFDASKLPQAHAECQSATEYYMSKNKTVAVANTFTQEWEMQPYYDLAQKYGYTVFSIILENRHGSKNVHGVPEQVINNMRDRFSVKL